MQVRRDAERERGEFSRASFPAAREQEYSRCVRARVAFLLGVCVLCLACAVTASTAILPGFRSPSGNVRCLFLPAGRDDSGHRLPSQILCTIRQAGYVKRLQSRCMGPAGAGVDWHGWRLSPAGKGQVVCSGGILYNSGTDRPSYVTLPYGTSWPQGVFRCWSRVIGVTCQNRKGNGLFISRQSWRAW